MKLFNKNISLNIISNIYIKYHLLISISIFIILTLLFFNLGLIDEQHKWLDGEEYIARSKNIDFLNLNFLGIRDGFRPPLFPIVLHFYLFCLLALHLLIKL